MAESDWTWMTDSFALFAGSSVAGVRRQDVSDIAIAFDGRVDNQLELAAKTRMPTGTAVVDLLITGYRTWGLELPAQIVGNFALAIIDRATDTTLLARDAVGTHPLYYTQLDDDALLFATACTPLRKALGARARPDCEALARLLCAPQTLSATDSFVRDVLSVPPGHMLVHRRAGAQLRQFWLVDDREYEQIAFEDCVAEFRKLLFRAVERRIPQRGRTGVLVSGGLDSSSVFAVARALGADVFGVYYGAEDGGPSDESGFVRQLESLAAPITRVPLLPTGYPDSRSGDQHRIAVA
jgi:asparagine synthase (glutamine-hydrolysing)